MVHAAAVRRGEEHMSPDTPRGGSEGAEEMNADTSAFEEIMHLSPNVRKALRSMDVTSLDRLTWLRRTPDWFRARLGIYLESLNVTVADRLIVMTDPDTYMF